MDSARTIDVCDSQICGTTNKCVIVVISVAHGKLSPAIEFSRKVYCCGGVRNGSLFGSTERLVTVPNKAQIATAVLKLG